MQMTAPLLLLFSQPSMHPWGKSGGRYLRRVERVYSRIYLLVELNEPKLYFIYTLFTVLEALQPVHPGQGCLGEFVLDQSVQSQTKTRFATPKMWLGPAGFGAPLLLVCKKCYEPRCHHPAGKSSLIGREKAIR